MRQRFAAGLCGLVLSLSAGGTASLWGQDPRDACVAEAGGIFDPVARQKVLSRCLDPSVGAPGGAWTVAIQMLAQTLIADGRDSLAQIWLRWAVRRVPGLQPDTLRFLPRVIAAYRAARDFASRTRTAGDSATATTWLWPAQENADATGRLQVAAALGVPLQVTVQGVGVLGVGGSVALGPGSYQISAAAQGYDSVRVTREVMPGVTTVLEFHPRPTHAPVVLVPPRPTPTTPAPGAQAQPPKKGGFPVVWAVVGAAAVGGAVALLAGKSSPTKGSITYTYNP